MEDMSKEGGEEERRDGKKEKEQKRERENTRMNLVLGRLGKGGGEGHQ